ncbi:flagellar basal body P-ring formation chaperone FlgA [Rugamonas sp.]|uniref:flagellar basal body P-ring formation chaperone FlgA n=1 Tax=Rugamonas sp. TaxID=1926287 RepID=UPI002600187A|nr:flagellar basal body P-ring formation chaperone FlgA [Rugamonas sp.]
MLFGTIIFSAGAETLPAQLVQLVQDAATAQLQRDADAHGWLAPKFDVNVVHGSRPLAACAQAVTVQTTDARQPTRMRMLAVCPGADGWKYEFIVRALVSAEVVVTTQDIPAGKVFEADDLALERHDISGIGDSVNDVQAALGLRGRRSLRGGDVLRLGVLAQPEVVLRGQMVRIVARREQIEVSMSGEALDNGARDAIVRVRNASGTVIRARVKGAGLVEPADMPASTQSPG